MSLGQLLMTVLLVLAAGLGFFYWWGHYYKPTATVSGAVPISGQYDITVSDNGKTFTYSQTSRFTVYLNGQQYDTESLGCKQGSNILGEVSNVPATAAPMIAKRFEVTAAGSCTLSTNNFSVTIIGQSDL